MITEITPELQQRMDTVRDNWLAQLKAGAELDIEAAAEGIHWLYKLADIAAPKIEVTASPMDAQTRAQRYLNTSDFVPYAWYGGIGDYGWMARYEVFIGQGVYDEPTEQMLLQYKKLLQANIYDCIQLSEVCLIIPMPSTLERLDTKLHSETGPAISWKGDGYSQYWLHGVAFTPELHKAVTSKTITRKKLLSIINVEQRMAALRCLGNEWLLEGQTLVSTSPRGNELWKVTGVFEDPAYYLKYTCPSTGRVYVTGVDPAIGVKGNPDECMAHNRGISLKLYNQLRCES